MHYIGMIAPIINTGIYQLNNSPKKQSFYRSNSCFDSVSFCSKNLLTKTSEEISKAVGRAISDKANFLGEGVEGRAYRLPDTDYCVKIMDKEPADYGQWRFDIKPNERVNHILAKAENNAVIMKYIEGVNLMNEPRIAPTLPEKSIKDLLLQIVNANDEAMIFDGAPSNVIYNPKDKSLKAIDFYQDYEHENITARPLTQLFSSLSVKDSTPEAMALNKKLGGKILNIVVDELSQGKEPQFPIDKTDLNRLMNKIKFSQYFNTPPQYEFLCRSLNNMLNLKQEQQYGKDITRELNGEVKYSKCIIKQCLS